MVIFLFLLGSVFGSFVHASALRYTDASLKSSLVSRCSLCHHHLSFSDMILCIRGLFLKEGCLFCHVKIPFSTWLSVVFSGCWTVFLCSNFKKTTLLGALILFFSLLYASLTDMNSGLIPDRTHILLLLGILCYKCPHLQNLFFSFCVFLLFFLAAKWSQSLGYGDVKLISVFALLFSPYQLVQLICIASCSALLIVLPLLAQKKIMPDTEIPFGPFLSLSALICLFF